jgi:hypothetical protein
MQTPETIIASLREALTEKDKTKTEDSIKTLRVKAAAKRVKAGILTNPRLFVPTLDVLPNGETIILRGIIHCSRGIWAGS